MTSFEAAYGFSQAELGLHNWRERPFNRWSFQHVDEVVPVARVAACGDGATALPVAATGLGSETIDAGGRQVAIADLLSQLQTDSFLVSRDGRLAFEWHAPHVDPARPHLLFSVSKSITALLAGILEDQGLIDPQRPVSHYWPATSESGFGDCSVQHVLDMRVSLDFVEDYLDKTGGYARYRRATAWNPPLPGETSQGLEAFLLSVRKGDGPHGGAFRYLSPCSDMLGLLIEKVAGEPYADLMSRLLWKPLGATTDAVLAIDEYGAPRGAGGICATPRDLLRLGEMVLNGGVVDGRQVVSERWLDDTWNGGDASAWANGDFAGMMTGCYRNKWYIQSAPAKAVYGIGIHGQWLYIDPGTRVVIAKTGSQALPMDERVDAQNLELLRQVASMV